MADFDLVLNAAGPFLHTAAPLADACLNAGVHYIDIGNELQVFCALYDLHKRAEQAEVAIIPGVGFGVVATNSLARYVSEAVGGAAHLEVATGAPPPKQAPVPRRPEKRTCPTEAGPAKKANCTRSPSARAPKQSISPTVPAALCSCRPVT